MAKIIQAPEDETFQTQQNAPQRYMSCATCFHSSCNTAWVTFLQTVDTFKEALIKLKKKE
jgi:hypothetical protein